ncbi:hypothetical protein SAMN02910353_02672 [Ruminococcus sp. YRD2003]|uniref:beta strand repeat-containing protein n=1 Tax=Ruminococcus sp. YRD2003 TaxID=1452313 RepID=UPI0008D34322|nr:hypothetical protein SAMN02910353_02672 [Ruminococcus flavefaciens]
MNKRQRKEKHRKIRNRTISLTTSLSLLIGCLPVSELPACLNKINELLSKPITAAAEVKPRYNIADFTTPGETVNGEDCIKISSFDDLAKYSEAYYNWSIGESGYTNHQNDIIFIAIASSTGNNVDMEQEHTFEPIGTSDYPFKGKIIFENGSPTTFNMRYPLFGEVYDCVQIEGTDGEIKPITINRTLTTEGAPLIANKIRSDGKSDTTASWNVTFGVYDDDAVIRYGGAIGEIEDGAAVNLTFTNNATSTVSSTDEVTGETVQTTYIASVEAKATANNDDGYPVDAGALCGTLKGSLTAKYTGTNFGYYVTSDNGNAGGLVGSMGSGASLTISNDSSNNLQVADGKIEADNGYAGGIVGSNNGGTVTMNVPGYDIEQFILGSNGAGGLFGYYAPPVGTSTLDVSKYDINCKVALTASGTGYTGGLIGKCESFSGANITIKGEATTANNVTTYTGVISDHASLRGEGVKSTAYGGLIGSYKAEALSDSLKIKTLTAVPSNTLSSAYFGGAISYVAEPADSNAAYVEFDTFSLTSAAGASDATLFGGLVAKTTNGYLYSKDVTIGTSSISEFNGGSLVGDIGNGVLGMTGNVDLSNASPKAEDGNGQLVGTRGDALIYAESWTYTPNSVEIDNVGSWGDVLVLDGTKLTNANVFTIADHAITIASPTESTTDSKTYKDISTVADYAKVSLLFQINTNTNKIIQNNIANFQASTNISFKNTSSLDLSDTGLRGITRDNGSTAVEYSGTVAGNNHTIILDIKNVGGSDRPVYRKQYLGLVAIAKGASFKNIDFDGTILNINGRTTKDKTSAYVGTAAATVSDSVNCSDCNTLSDLSITLTGGVSTIAGRLIGEATGSAGNITISGSEFDGDITGNTGNANCIIGGVIGKISGGASNAVWSFDDVTLKGNVTGIQKIGGLIAVLDGSSKATVKIGETAAVKTDGIEVEGNNGTSMGGLFGHDWKNADVVIDGFKVNDTSSRITTVKQTGAGGTAGLAYSASGHWTVNKLDLRNIKMLTSNASSVGMIVNKGKISSDGIYLELPSGYDYKLSLHADSTFKATNGVFDEICAYSADNANSIMKNGQGIVSISTYDGTNSSSNKLKMASSSNADNTNTGITYQAQTSKGATANPNTRYYYNLDLIDTGNAGTRTYADLSTASDKLMRWGVYRYAASNIQKHFKVNDNDTFEFSSSADYDMRGYSWYPITLDSAVTVAGTFTFYNEEFTTTENANNSITNKWSPLSATQHYMMQNGIFYDVNANLTVGTVVLSGNIGAVNTKGTGALVYGTVKGKSSATNDITTINSMSGSVSLAGIKVWNFQGTDGVSADYAPLLINRTGSFVSLKIGNISTGSGYSAGEEAATSLIGYVGASSTDSGVTNSDTDINIDFSNIRLDGRKSANTPGLSGYNYNTTKSIFTRATLLERSLAKDGSYTFSYVDDWSTVTGGYKHSVTYGEEIGYTSALNGNTQYPSLEQYYSRESATDDNYPTQYSSIPTKNATPSDSFTGFLPYVRVVSAASEISSGTSDHYQLKVNHQPSLVIEGCGTYTDPYIIKNADELIRVSKWINGAELSTAVINARFDNTFCDGDDHLQYSYSGGSFKNGSSTKSQDEMRQYLAGAYYVIRPISGTNIELAADSGFVGLGNKTEGFHFRGVIIGGVSNASITNKTQYPLINYSDGSVIKDLTINVDADITLDDATETYNYITEGKKYSYGSVIAAVAGGDNIIDNVQVNFGSHTIKVTGTKAQFQAVGGYVGVIVNGGVIFKNMTGNITGLSDANVITDPTSNTTNQSPTNKRTNMASSSNTAWLYVNPIIGRVVNGFAVTESDAYRPFEDGTRTVNGTTTYWAKKKSDSSIGAVDSNTYNTDDYELQKTTMQNGTKHYSIADIKSAWLKESGSLILSDAEKLEVSSSYAITARNAQSFYIMSLIVNSGMGTEQNFTTDNANTGNKIGYYNAGRYQTVRRAEYNTVGTKASNADYLLSINDTYAFAAATKLNNIPYLIAKYTKPVTTDGTDYYAKNIANSNNTCSITLSGGTYYLPDGFQGIGGKIISKKGGSNGSTDITNDSSLRINNFIGAGSTISLNMNYNYYYSYKDATSLYVFDNTYIHIDNVGLGLFNIQNGTTNNVDSSRYYNFIITGNVKAECIDNKFTNGKDHIPYVGPMTGTTQKATDGIDRINMISVGSLIGTMKARQTIDSVALQDVDVKGIRYTGGMIGWNPNDNKSINTSITINNTQSNGSYGIKVHGAGNTGGMIGRSYQSEISIDNNNATYSIIEVESDCENRTGNDYNYGVGGFIGNCRGGGSSLVEIKNVTVGTLRQDSLTYVNSASAEINAGGMIGIVNKCKLNLSDCTIYNQNVESQYTAAGLVGYFASSGADSTIKNVKITCKDGLNGTIMSHQNFAGGFLGAGKRDVNTINISESEVNNYTITGNNYAGGIVGLWGHNVESTQKANKIITNNVTVSDCTISCPSGYAGGIIGYLNYVGDAKKKEYYGYNILAKNLAITGATNQTGALCGGTCDTTYNIIKIVAFCQNNDEDKGPETTEVVGGGNNYGYDPNTTGAKGYVICADYNGVVSNTAWIDDVSSKTRVIAASPYVNMNPITEIDAASTPKRLLSDGASLAAVNQIQYDIENSVAGYYSNASTVENVLKSKISNIVDEMGSRTFNIGDRNFPVLIVDDISKINTTNRINYYIALLTNSDPSLSWAFNYAANEKNVYNVVLHKCVYDANGNTITIKSAQPNAITGSSTNSNATPCLKRTSGQFYMNANDTDTIATNGQFTLLDIQYLNPSATGQIAYHLYVPVYVRKVLQYDFNIRAESGTSYKVTSPASAIQGNVLVENIGTPVTLEFAYTYKRTADEWIEAVNGGDTLLGNYSKRLLFDNLTAGGANLPSTTKMVLIDTQYNSKAYYLNNLYSGGDNAALNTSSGYLDLSKFSNGSSSYSPVSFNDMMVVTIKQDDSGTLVNSSLHPHETYPGIVTDNSGGTNNGITFRYSEVGETGIDSSDRYTVDSITFRNGGTYLTEHYFLTIYTDYSTAQTIYHYAISAGKTLGNEPYPSRITKDSERNATNLFLGYVYDQEIRINSLKVGGDATKYCLSATDNDNQLSADLTARVFLTEAAKTGRLITYIEDTRNHVQIFESLLIQFNKHDSVNDIGVKGVEDVEVTSYKIGNQNVTDLNRSWTKRNNVIVNASYIELQNNVSLADKLTLNSDKSVLITASTTITFEKTTGLPDQFYQQSLSGRTNVIAISKISSKDSLTAFSKVSKETTKLWDAENEIESSITNQYYMDSTEKAYITHDALDMPAGKDLSEIGGQLPQLGINANDPNDVKKFPSTIHTVGTYRVEDCPIAWGNAQSIVCEVELRSIDSSYTELKPMFKYIEGSTFNILDGISPTSTEYLDSSGNVQVDGEGTPITSPNEFTYKVRKTYTKASLNSMLDSNVYKIPIEFKVYSGSIFETAGLEYANYGLYLKVYMLDSSNDEINVTTNPESDYVKYTNARICLTKVS